MKNLKRFAFLFLILVIVILSFTIYTSLAKDKTSDIKEKVLSEIKFLDSKFISIFNSLNNIEFENYKISVEDISEKSKSSSENSSGAGESEDTTKGDSGGDTSDSNSDSSSSSSTNSNETSTDTTKKFSLNAKGILTSNEDINWDFIKNEAEILESSLSIITLDLYEVSLNSNDIIAFNKEYDNLLVEVKNENKENTLKELSLLYSYIPKFLKNCNAEEEYKVSISTKENIFNAYSILDSEDWESIGNFIQKANDNFSKLMTDVNLENKNQFTINKCYILINDMQNAVNTKDKEIFLIKYKNLLEELNNL